LILQKLASLTVLAMLRLGLPIGFQQALAKAQESIAIPDIRFTPSPIDFRAACRCASLTRKRRPTAMRDC
jgi:hypothetical protein